MVLESQPENLNGQLDLKLRGLEHTDHLVILDILQLHLEMKWALLVHQEILLFNYNLEQNKIPRTDKNFGINRPLGLKLITLI